MKEIKEPYLVENQVKEFDEKLLLRNARKRKLIQGSFQKSCAYCLLQKDYSIPLEVNLEEFSYKSIEEDVTEVLCIRDVETSPLK